jgi:hypothetical protein
MYVVVWAICIAYAMRHLGTFMRSRYNDPITSRQFPAEVAGRLLLLSTSTSIPVYWYGLGPIAGKPAAQMHQLWRLHLGHTCMFGYVAIMRFQSIYFESRCGKAQLSSFSWLAPHVEKLSFALMAMAGCKHVSTVVPSLGLLAYAMLLGAP